jgi:hypothetical protein
LGKDRLAKAAVVQRGLIERLVTAFTDKELQEAKRLMGKFRNQVLKETGRQPVPFDAELPNQQRVIAVLRGRRGGSRR